MISIIIPVYQVEPYIRQCLESVAAQTYKDIEVIIVDDCGTDRSLQVAQEFVKEYEKNGGPIAFKIVSHSENKGTSAAKNTGLSIARGEYISFVDSDDYIVPEAYETMKGYFDNSPSDVGIIMCGIHTYTDGVVGDFFKTDSLISISPGDFLDYMMTGKAPCSVGGKLYSSSIIDGVLFREGCRNEDVLFAFDSYESIESRGISSLVIPEQLYYYRQRSGSICHDDSFYVEAVGYLEEIMDKLRTEKYPLFLNQRTKYLDLVVRVALGAKSKSSPIHDSYFPLCKKLKNIPDSVAKEHLTKERYKRYIMLKYFPFCYEVISKGSLFNN